MWSLASRLEIFLSYFKYFFEACNSTLYYYVVSFVGRLRSSCSPHGGVLAILYYCYIYVSVCRTSCEKPWTNSTIRSQVFAAIALIWWNLERPDLVVLDFVVQIFACIWKCRRCEYKRDLHYPAMNPSECKSSLENILLFRLRLFVRFPVTLVMANPGARVSPPIDDRGEV